jgi:hypothetical protein
MNDALVDRFDALRDSIVAHLEQVQLQLHADIEGAIHGVERWLREGIQGVEQRLTRRLDSVDARLESLRAEMAERFDSVDQRFRVMELRMTLFENKNAAEIAAIRTAIDNGVCASGAASQQSSMRTSASASTSQLPAHIATALQLAH